MVTIKREASRNLRRARVIKRSAVGALVITLAIGAASVHSRVAQIKSKEDFAQMLAVEYILEAYPRWLAAHPNRECPTVLGELSVYTDHSDVMDPWGTDFRMFCGSHGLIIQSSGEDRIGGTHDDVWRR